MFDVDGVLYRVAGWKEIICTPAPELGYFPKIDSSELARREKAAVAADRAAGWGTNVHQINTEVLLEAINSRALPLNPELLTALCKKRRNEIFFEGVPQTLKDVAALVDVVSRTDPNRPESATAQQYNIINSCGVVPVMAAMLHDVPLVAVAGQELIWSPDGHVDFLGIDIDTGMPVAVPHRVYEDNGKGRFAAWVRGAMGLREDSMYYMFDGETDGRAVFAVTCSQQVYEEAFEPAVDRMHEVAASLPLSTLTGASRFHQAPRKTDWSRRAPLHEWAVWANKLAAVVEQRPLSPADMQGAPADGEARASVLAFQTVAALSARMEVTHGIVGDRFGPTDVAMYATPGRNNGAVVNDSVSLAAR